MIQARLFHLGARARPWTRCRAMRGVLLRAGSAGLSMRFISTQHKAIEAEASVCTTLRENGTGCRAEALPKVLTLFEDAHPFRKVSILENPEDSFEDAHLFARCARKVRTFETKTVPN
jgi:hypothetical protein